MSYHKNPNRREHSYNDPVPKPLSQQTNYIINREFKPLYAFLLALATDVLMLENNQVDFNRAGGGVFLNVFGKSVGWRNIYFASSIALGVSVGENIGLWCSTNLQLQLQLAPVTHSILIYTIALTNTSQSNPLCY